MAALAGGCGGVGNSGEAATGIEIVSPVLEEQESGTTALLQAVSAVDGQTAWVSGHRGTWGRTTDGGETWTIGIVPGADTLQFRDVHARSADLAWLLAAGPGDMSRIYRTDDGGGTWTLQWTNDEPDGFYDCLDFWSDERGAVYGDAVGGRLRILRTVDGGEAWTRLAGDALPRAQLGEGGFAASGTCLAAGPGGRGWIATGNAADARVLRTDDWGASWTAFRTPIRGGEGAGLFSIAFRDSLHGVIVGGDLAPVEEAGEGETADGAAADDAAAEDAGATIDTGAVAEAEAEAGAVADTGGAAAPAADPRVAISDDGGVTWKAAGQPGTAGALFGAAWVPGTDPPAAVVVAPSGAAWSSDDGRSWLALDGAAYWGLGFAADGVGWLVGPEGRITRVSFRSN